tara:strand:+ start:28222 stop:28641 length:420 start_codon:yes stop_codon:yes gene_type:complete
MKKILFILLVVIVPFSTLAQKRNKKDIKENTENTVNFMIIKGIEIPVSNEENNEVQEEMSIDMKEIELKKMLKPDSKLLVMFDYGNSRSQELSELILKSKSIVSMAGAVQVASQYGWEFVSANVMKEGNITRHYYYMKR